MGKFCPPCCTNCAFSPIAQPVQKTGKTQLIVSGDDYGCKLPGGREIMISDGVLGAQGSDGFHPITEAGRAFHIANGSPLAEISSQRTSSILIE